MKRQNGVFVLVLVLSLILGLGTILLLNRTTPIKAQEPTSFEFKDLVRAKIEPRVLKEVLLEEPVDVIVYLHQISQDKLPKRQNGQTLLDFRRQLIDVLQEQVQQSQAGVVRLLKTHQAKNQIQSFQSLWIVNAVAVKGLTQETLIELSQQPEVEFIREDKIVTLPKPPLREVAELPALKVFDEIQPNIQRIRAPLVWPLGVTGENIVVAIMDTGVDWQHPDLQDNYLCYHGLQTVHSAFCWKDFTLEEANYPIDPLGHGTPVLGTALQVAPNAKWIAMRIFNRNSQAYYSWIHRAFQWLIAPGNDSSKAPDVINVSWGMTDGSDEEFRLDIQTLTSAGIVVVASAGNGGPNYYTLDAPGSYSETTLTVGAIDSDDEVANFSSRGPSYWDELKPEVMAPGVNICSAVPGGGYDCLSGTSLAAPHVSGVVALMFSANSGLNPSEVRELLIRSTDHLGRALPDYDYGFGLVDAYSAVLSVMPSLGRVSGQVVNRVDQTPIANATISIVDWEGEPLAQFTTGERGQFYFALPEGLYTIGVAAFGYQHQNHTLFVAAGQEYELSFQLESAPPCIIVGLVTDLAGSPVSATIKVLGTPVEITTNPAWPGRFAVQLPAGMYQLRVEAWGYHIIKSQVIELNAAETVRVDFTLPTAPRILLIDAGAWYYGNQIRYFTEALENLGLPRHVWSIEHLPNDLPQLTDLQNYDVVVWLDPFGSPGYIGADQLLTDYLDSGGHLFLTGQDIAFWDGGGMALFVAEYLYGQLGVRFVRDNSDSWGILVQEQPLFALEGFSIQGGSGANNQLAPDVVKFRNDDGRGFSALRYQDGTPAWKKESAGLAVCSCVTFRAVYLPFGFEGIAQRTVREQIFQNVIDYLANPLVARDFQLEKLDSWPIAPAGEEITLNFSLRNASSLSETFTLELTQTDWPAVLSLSEVTLAPCEEMTGAVKVRVPVDVLPDAKSKVALKATLVSARLEKSLDWQVKTPAQVLLVEIRRYEYPWSAANLEKYRLSLQGVGKTVDVWTIGSLGRVPAGPSLAIMQNYPLIVWFSGYEWYAPMEPQDQINLTAYLQNGGGLLLSSQDYLWVEDWRRVWGWDLKFEVDFLGVAFFADSAGYYSILGKAETFAASLGPYSLTSPFGGSPGRSHQDVITPTATAEVVLEYSGTNLGACIANKTFRWRTLFCAFSLEALSEPNLSEFFRRTLPWLVERTTVERLNRIYLPWVLRRESH